MMPAPQIKSEIMLLSQSITHYDFNLATSSTDEYLKNTIKNVTERSTNLNVYRRVYNLSSDSIHLISATYGTTIDNIEYLGGLEYGFDSNVNKYMGENLIPYADTNEYETKSVSYGWTQSKPLPLLNDFTIFAVFRIKKSVREGYNKYFLLAYKNGQELQTLAIYVDTEDNFKLGLGIVKRLTVPPAVPDFLGDEKYNQFLIDDEEDTFIIYGTGSFSDFTVNCYVNGDLGTISSASYSSGSYQEDYIVINTYPLLQKVGEVVIFDRILSSSDINDIYSHLSDKWLI